MVSITQPKGIIPEWIAGFCIGESSFSILITGKYASVRFSIYQDLRDIILLENIGKVFTCGIVNKIVKFVN